MTGVYCLAGHAFEITSLHPFVHRLFSGFKSGLTPEFTVLTAQADVDCEREKSAREDEAEGIPVRNFSAAYLESLAVYRKLCERLIEDDIILFHSSAIKFKGKGYLFTAPSGTGKSTHVKFWKQCFGEEVTYINDDKPLIKIHNGNATVFGTPYGGKENLASNISAPIGGIVILHRAEQNKVERLTPHSAYPQLFSQTYRTQNLNNIFKTMDLVKSLSNLPVYSMGCNLSPEAARVAMAAITEGEI